MLIVPCRCAIHVSIFEGKRIWLRNVILFLKDKKGISVSGRYAWIGVVDIIIEHFPNKQNLLTVISAVKPVLRNALSALNPSQAGKP